MDQGATSSAGFCGELDLRMKNLTCDEPEIDLSDDDDENQTVKIWDLCVIGKVITDKYIDPDSIMRSMRNAWHKQEKVKMGELDNGLVSFQFANDEDLRLVLQKGPWLVHDYPLVLVRWKANTPVSEISFHFIPFWIKAYNIPCEKIKHSTGVKMGMIAGKSLGVDFVEDRDSRCKFLRFQAMINITKPVATGTWIKMENQKRVWSDFRYERLPVLCFECGVIGHMKRNCKKFNDKKVLESDGDEPARSIYGPWLKALTRVEEIAARKAELEGSRLNTQLQTRLKTGRKEKEFGSDPHSVSPYPFRTGSASGRVITGQEPTGFGQRRDVTGEVGVLIQDGPDVTVQTREDVGLAREGVFKSNINSGPIIFSSQSLTRPEPITLHLSTKMHEKPKPTSNRAHQANSNTKYPKRPQSSYTHPSSNTLSPTHHNNILDSCPMSSNTHPEQTEPQFTTTLETETLHSLIQQESSQCFINSIDSSANFQGEVIHAVPRTDHEEVTCRRKRSFHSHDSAKQVPVPDALTLPKKMRLPPLETGSRLLDEEDLTD